MTYNPELILDAAAVAKGRSDLLIGSLEGMEGAEIAQAGADIKRAGRSIELEGAEWEAPWVPEPPPPDEEPPLGGNPTIPVLTISKEIKKTMGSCLVVKGDNYQLANTRLAYGEWMGLDIPKNDPVNGTVGLRVGGCEFVTGWNGDHKGWGCRGYDLADFEFLDCNFLCELPLAVNIEHGAYLNIYRGGKFIGCFFYGNAGQAIQLVWTGRENESANAAGLTAQNLPGDVVLVQDCKLYNIGSFKSGRASFAISMFKGQVGLTIQDSLIQKTNEPQTHGAILFQGSNRETLQLLNTRVFYTGTPDREAVQVTNAKDALVDGGEYYPGAAIKGFRFMDCGQVEFTGNAKGNAEVWVGKGGVWQTKTTLAKVGAGTVL